MAPGKLPAGAPALLLALLITSTAHAAPDRYRYSTASGPFGNPDVSALITDLGTGVAVSGAFLYDNTVPLTSVIALGHLHVDALRSLTGSVGAYSFNDPAGRAIAGNSVSPGTQIGVDFLQLAADPPPLPAPGNRDLFGFNAGGLALVNVRLFWTSPPEFIDAMQELPGTLPAFPGRLALDFAGGKSVFFNGLQVRPVPEPGVWPLALLGLVLLMWLRRSRPSDHGRDD